VRTSLLTIPKAAVGGSYAFVSTASANLRTKDDMWNQVYGGLAAGAILGLRSKTSSMMAKEQNTNPNKDEHSLLLSARHYLLVVHLELQSMVEVMCGILGRLQNSESNAKRSIDDDIDDRIKK
jgi:hypothetical protein